MAFLEWLRHAMGGPGHLRFVIQPAVAVLLGLRDGRLDALAGRVPYLWGLIFQGHRKAQLGAALRAAAVPLVVAIVVDSLLQLYTMHTLRPAWAVLVGLLLVALPYTVARALGNRATRVLRHGTAQGDSVSGSP